MVGQKIFAEKRWRNAENEKNMNMNSYTVIHNFCDPRLMG